MTGRWWCVKAVRGEEEEEEEEEVEAEEAPLGEGTAPQKPDFSDFFRAPAGDGIPAKNHDEDEERVMAAVCFCLCSHCLCGSNGRRRGRRGGQFGRGWVGGSPEKFKEGRGRQGGSVSCSNLNY